MDNIKVKLLVYSLILSVIGTLFTVALMKSMHSAQSVQDNRTAAQKLGALEDSSAVTSPEAKQFLHDQKLREQGNEEAEQAVKDLGNTR